jgi:hypothetical protein
MSTRCTVRYTMTWQLLILSLPTDNATARMRAWRALKACGAVVLRDGVYALPDGDGHSRTLATVAADVREHGGTARLMRAQSQGEDLAQLFDRSAAYGALLAQIGAHAAPRGARAQSEAMRRARRLRKAFDQLSAIDFFAGDARCQAAAALEALEFAVAQAQSPGEPHAAARDTVPKRERAAYRGRLWATRRRPWIDRLASAWLIRRWIDPEARFAWLKTPADCPNKAVGFDFDGAEFSHVGTRVTFETLLAAFELESPALRRLGVLVHGLDAGGVQSAEAVGVERVLAGMREAITDDDQLVLAAAGVFEGLFVAFEKESAQ